MDNRLFNINGDGEAMLLKALELAFMQQSAFNPTCSGWQQTKEHGLILCWTANHKDITPFPADLTAQQCLPFITQWLAGDFAKDVELSKMCHNADHDGSNSLGWQVYCEDWGHVGEQHYATCAIKPAYLWHGK